MCKQHVHLFINILFPLAALTILVLSLLPTLSIPPSRVPFADKIAHMAAYLILGALGYLFYYFKRPLKIRAFIFSIVLCSLWGIGIEFLQAYTGRTPELLDGIMDFFGAAFGTLLMLTLWGKYLTER